MNKYSRVQEIFFESGHQVKNLAARLVFLLWLYVATTDIFKTYTIAVAGMCVYTCAHVQ